MKKHVVATICLSSFLAFTFSNCSEPKDAQYVYPGSKVIAPTFSSTSSESNELDNLSRDFARVSSMLGSYGNADIIQHGHLYEMEYTNPISQSTPTEVQRQTELGSIATNTAFPYRFTSYLLDLTAGAHYTVTPYVTTRKGTFFGPTSHFQTLSQSQQ